MIGQLQRPRDPYLMTHNIHRRYPRIRAGVEPRNPNKRTGANLICALGRAATGLGKHWNNFKKRQPKLKSLEKGPLFIEISRSACGLAA